MMEIFLKGIGVGFAVAAPVGPIGLLCIKRTLDHGRTVGLATGFGAATADAIYGIMVAAGLAVTGLLVSYALPLQLFGGLLIAFLGLLSIKSFLFKPQEPAKTAIAPDTRHVMRAFSTTFALTLSNPMTIIAFVALISGLGSTANSNTSYWAPYWLVFGIFLGSALWWLLLVHAALFARSKMTTAIMRTLDLLSGLVLLVWGSWIAVGAIRAFL